MEVHRVHRHMMKILIFLWFPFLIESVTGQEVGAALTIDKEEVVQGEPLDLRITVYTSTFFTRGINPGNISVDGAFSVYFRPLSKSYRKEGVTYAGVELQYRLFPFQTGELTIPALEFAVETPEEGDFRGKKLLVNTGEKRIQVRAVPSEYRRSPWLVSNTLEIEDSFLADSLEVTVGEVLNRKVVMTTAGTVGEMIPPLPIEDKDEVRVYRKRPKVDTQKEKTDITGYREEDLQYHFRKEGVYELPETAIYRYSPVDKKVYTHNLKPVVVKVIPGEEAGLLTTVKDTLSTASAEAAKAGQKGQGTIMGLSYRAFVLLGSGILLILVLGYFAVGKAAALIRRKYAAYHNSEAYYFKQFVRASVDTDYHLTIKSLYEWLDKTKLQPATIAELHQRTGIEALLEEEEKIHLALKGENGGKILDSSVWRLARQQLQKPLSSSGVNSGEHLWINP